MTWTTSRSTKWAPTACVFKRDCGTACDGVKQGCAGRTIASLCIGYVGRTQQSLLIWDGAGIVQDKCRRSNKLYRKENELSMPAEDP